MRLIDKATRHLTPEQQERQREAEKKHNERLWKDLPYREGYYYGNREGYLANTRNSVQQAFYQVRNEGYPRNNSLRDTRQHHFGPYHIHAIHGRSLKPGRSKLTSTTDLEFVQTGDEDNSGLAIFTLQQSWRPRKPIITGIYQFDPNDSRVSPVLKGFEVTISRTEVQWQDHRRLVQMFMNANGLPAWFIRDSKDGEQMLVPVAAHNKWWATPTSWYGQGKSKKYLREADEIRAKHKYRVRYWRAADMLTRDGVNFSCAVMWNPDTQEWSTTQ